MEFVQQSNSQSLLAVGSPYGVPIEQHYIAIFYTEFVTLLGHMMQTLLPNSLFFQAIHAVCIARTSLSQVWDFYLLFLSPQLQQVLS